MADPLLKLSCYLFVCVLFLLFDVFEHDSFFVHNFHVEICWVGVSWDGKADFRKVVS